jgi:hypothetical protein
MFEPSKTWTHLYEFEKSLMDFFAAHGMEAEVIKPIEGLSSGRILLIAKMELVDAPVKNEPIKQPSEIVKAMTDRKPSKAELKFKNKK